MKIIHILIKEKNLYIGSQKIDIPFYALINNQDHQNEVKKRLKKEDKIRLILEIGIPEKKEPLKYPPIEKLIQILSDDYQILSLKIKDKTIVLNETLLEKNKDQIWIFLIGLCLIITLLLNQSTASYKAAKKQAETQQKIDQKHRKEQEKTNMAIQTKNEKIVNIIEGLESLPISLKKIKITPQSIALSGHIKPENIPKLESSLSKIPPGYTLETHHIQPKEGGLEFEIHWIKK